MALNVEMVTFDCVDPATLAEWWAEQFEGETQELIPGEFIAVIRADGPRLGFQKVEDPTPGKNRVHLDFGAADVDAEVSRLTAAGATEVGRHSIGDNFRWGVLAAPQGPAAQPRARPPGGGWCPPPRATRSASRAASSSPAGSCRRWSRGGQSR